MNKEIEIPEGYEVRIDGNRVIIELKESKDERIRTRLIALVEAFGQGEYKNEMLAYLERQKEQQPTEWSEGEKKVLDSIIDDYEKASKSFCGYDGKIMLLKAIRDGEYDLSKQEWSEEDKEMLRIISNRLDKFSEWATEQGFPIDDPTMKQSPIAWFKSLPERFNLQPKLKWNEEDEWKRNELLKYLEEKGDYRSTWYSWLKSFPERFNLPPKQEWSEESRRRLDRIQMVLESWDRSHTSVAGLPSTIPDDIDWLKSLHPQPHWKPSEEQMKALEDAFRKDGGNEYRKVINSLYCDLQKLL